VAAEPSNDAPRASRTSAPVPPAQTTLPGFSGGTGDVRQRILRDALHLLRGGGALTGRELADRLSKRDRRIDRHLVNSVLSHEGAGLVARNALTGKYSLKPS